MVYLFFILINAMKYRVNYDIYQCLLDYQNHEIDINNITFDDNAPGFSRSCHDAITLSSARNIVASNCDLSIHNCNRTVPDGDVNLGRKYSRQAGQTSGKILILSNDWMDDAALRFSLLYLCLELI